MSVLGIDLGGTKLAAAIFSTDGEILHKEVAALGDRQGREVGGLIRQQIQRLLSIAKSKRFEIRAAGISVPGIYYAKTGKVWAPNIRDWEDYPLLTEMRAMPELENIDIKIDSDRACYILGETWQGTARGCRDAIFLAVGTGIGAGILVDGTILRGHSDIAGAIGWLALDRPYRQEYEGCGCFEYHASGDGIAKVGRELLLRNSGYSGVLRQKDTTEITAYDIFEAYETNDPIAIRVLEDCIAFWGMAVANLVSLFNPEKIIFGGGVFGPAVRFLDRIREEASRWAQPISVKQVGLEVSTLGGDAGLIGAARLALGATNGGN